MLSYISFFKILKEVNIRVLRCYLQCAVESSWKYINYCHRREQFYKEMCV